MKQHKVIVEFLRDTDEDRSFASAIDPDAEFSDNLGALLLDELMNARDSNTITQGDMRVIEVIEDAASQDEIEKTALMEVIEARKLAELILTKNTISEEIRTSAFKLIENTTVLLDHGNCLRNPNTGEKCKLVVGDMKWIRDQLKSGQRISAIKKVRELTQWGLKDAKECCDILVPIKTI